MHHGRSHATASPSQHSNFPTQSLSSSDKTRGWSRVKNGKIKAWPTECRGQRWLHGQQNTRLHSIQSLTQLACLTFLNRPTLLYSVRPFIPLLSLLACPVCLAWTPGRRGLSGLANRPCTPVVLSVRPSVPKDSFLTLLAQPSSFQAHSFQKRATDTPTHDFFRGPFSARKQIVKYRMCIMYCPIHCLHNLKYNT